jgi:hypothetical protein
MKDRIKWVKRETYLYQGGACFQKRYGKAYRMIYGDLVTNASRRNWFIIEFLRQ